MLPETNDEDHGLPQGRWRDFGPSGDRQALCIEGVISCSSETLSVAFGRRNHPGCSEPGKALTHRDWRRNCDPPWPAEEVGRFYCFLWSLDQRDRFRLDRLQAGPSLLLSHG